MFKIGAAALTANTIGKTLGNSSNIAVLLGGAIHSIDIGAELPKAFRVRLREQLTNSQDAIFILEPLKNVFGEIIKSVAVLAQGSGS